jgi:hypothetical protein
VIRKNLDGISACYESIGVKEGVSGRLTFSFVIGAAGRITKNVVSKDKMQLPALEACMTRVMASWEFPAPRNGIDVTVNYPFKFDVDDKVTTASQAALLQARINSDMSCNNELSAQQDIILKLRIRKDGIVDESTAFLGPGGRPQELPCTEKLLRGMRFAVPKESDVAIHTFFIGVNVSKDKTKIAE